MEGPDVPLAFSPEELRLVNNALNEVANGLHFTDDELHARLGATREEIRDLLQRVARALRADLD